VALLGCYYQEAVMGRECSTNGKKTEMLTNIGGRANGWEGKFIISVKRKWKVFVWIGFVWLRLRIIIIIIVVALVSSCK
jgi:hypothetical protein